MIGFALRFLSADDLLRLLKGLENTNNEEVPLFGDFKLTVINNNRQYDLDFTNLDKYPDFRAGSDFFVDAYVGPTANAGWAWIPAPHELWKSSVEQKLQACRTYAATPNSSAERMYDCLKK